MSGFPVSVAGEKAFIKTSTFLTHEVDLIYDDKIYEFVVGASADSLLLLELIQTAASEEECRIYSSVRTDDMGRVILVGPSNVVMKIESMERRTRFGKLFNVCFDVALDDDEDVSHTQQMEAVFQYHHYCFL